MTSTERFHNVTRLALHTWYDIDKDNDGNCIIAVPLVGGEIFVWVAIEGNYSDIEKEMTEKFGPKPAAEILNSTSINNI